MVRRLQPTSMLGVLYFNNREKLSVIEAFHVPDNELGGHSRFSLILSQEHYMRPACMWSLDRRGSDWRRDLPEVPRLGTGFEARPPQFQSPRSSPQSLAVVCFLRGISRHQ